MFKFIDYLLEVAAKSLGEYLWRRLLRFPLAVAESVPLARAVTLAGFAILSAAFVSFAVHMARVQEAIRLTEEYARDTSQNVELLFARASAVADLAQEILQHQEAPLASQVKDQYPEVDTLLRLSEAEGMAIIVSGRVQVLRGSLDPTVTSSGWNNQRWSELSLRISRTLQGRGEALAFLGLERLYRNKKFLDRGGSLEGSLIVAKAWRDKRVGWVAVVILLPVASLSPLLHLTEEGYVSGNYDYLVDCDGNLLIHPRLYLVSGTNIDGYHMRAASNEKEVEQRPINTRDADWIAGGDMLSKAFNSMVGGVPQSIVYKNLKKQNRLTSFRLLNLSRHGMKGCLGVVAGRGLSSLEAITAPPLLKSPASLRTVLNVVVGVYVVLLGMWISLVIRIRSLQNDLVAWGRYASPSLVEGLGLIPIEDASTGAHVFADMIGLIVTFDVSVFEKAKLGDLFDEFGGIAAKLREEEWLVSQWSLNSLFACRTLRDKAKDNRPRQTWTPSRIVEYFSQFARGLDERSLSKLGPSAFRISYGIGELRVHASRRGAMGQAVISFYGSCLTDALYMEESLRHGELATWGWLFYSPADLDAAGLNLLGEEFICSRNIVYRRIALRD